MASVWGFVDRESSLTGEDIGPFVARRMPVDLPTLSLAKEDRMKSYKAYLMAPGFTVTSAAAKLAAIGNEVESIILTEPPGTWYGVCMLR